MLKIDQALIQKSRAHYISAALLLCPCVSVLELGPKNKPKKKPYYPHCIAYIQFTSCICIDSESNHVFIAAVNRSRVHFQVDLGCFVLKVLEGGFFFFFFKSPHEYDFLCSHLTKGITPKGQLTRD